MRFDLEIPSTYVDLTYISEGNRVPSSSIPLYYMDIDYRTKVPSDFLTINEDVVEDPTSELVFEEQVGPSFGLRGNRFLLTNVSKYSVEHNTKVPIFHKFVLNEKVSEFSIKIIDHLGLQIDRNEYIVEEGLTHTTIYLNEYNKILFAEYVSDNKAYKQLISLSPVFTEISWDDIVRNPGEIPQRKYLISDDGILQTSHQGALYMKYIHDIHILQPPVANIDDSWYVGINNTKFSVVDAEDSGITYSYEVPEFYIQNPMSQFRYEEVKEKKCKILFNDFIQTQSAPAPTALEKTRIFVKDYYTGELKYAFTTNKDLDGAKYENVYFSMAKDWNNNGVIQLPITLTSRDVVFATYMIKNEYYKLRFLNLNSVEVGQDHYFSVYMKPNPMDTELGVFFAIIGKNEDPNIETGVWRQGRAFPTVEEYEAFILQYNCYHVAMIGIDTAQQMGIARLTDVRSTGGEIENKEAATKLTPDIFYQDLMNQNLFLPTNDILIASVSADTILSKKLVNINRNTLSSDEYTKKYLSGIAKIVNENLEATTQSILEVDVSGNRILQQ